jgi:uncharacterized damage-inducible protein DinB
VIDAFLHRWEHVRGMTREFVEVMPDACLDERPGPQFATVREQAAHIIECQGCYQLAFRGETVDMGRKPEFTPSASDRDTLLASLARADAELAMLLGALDAPSFRLDWFGNRIGFWEYGSVFLQHEALHHGQWSAVARIGGWEPPVGWILNWGL